MNYTWEDFEDVILHPTTSTDPNDPVVVRRQAVFRYFAKYPEKLLEGGICKQLGYTAEQIRLMLQGKMTSPF